MNREQAKQLLPIIQAFADGADVQFKDSRGEWVTASDDPGLMYGAQWRIKTKPLEGWAVIDADGDVRGDQPRARLFLAECEAQTFSDDLTEMGASGQPYRIAHMVEVAE